MNWSALSLVIVSVNNRSILGEQAGKGSGDKGGQVLLGTWALAVAVGAHILVLAGENLKL